MITTIKKIYKGQRTSRQMHRNKITGNCLEKWHGGRAQGGGSLARWSHARGMRTYRPETKMAEAASERLFWSVDHLSFHSCTWRGGAEGWGLSLGAQKTTEASSCLLVSSKRLGSGSRGVESVLHVHALGLALGQSITDEARFTIAMRTRWESLSCAVTKSKPTGLPGGPGVKTVFNAGDMGLILGQETKLPPAWGN